LSADLRPEEFEDFFAAIHGVSPFPWQKRLAKQVFSAQWPRALDIPTGAGKTAAIDIAVFHLALDAARDAGRRAGTRILFVVDRRLVVDDAYTRAQVIAEKLAAATEGILKRTADRLRLLAENEDTPLAVVRLRGGMPKEPDWVRTPAQPTVVVSTVDQVGSRLLFRGYGVSDSMKPVHAGLLGCDALLLLDEAHLSQPFLQTLRDSMDFRAQPWVEGPAEARFNVVTLSATPSGEKSNDAGSGDVFFKISDDDRAYPTLACRLSASKPAELIEIKSGHGALISQFCDTAWQFAKNGCDVVAVVVNRVKRAREIFNALQGRRAVPLGAAADEVAVPEVALLIGRSRDIDRDTLLGQLLPSVQAGGPRNKRSKPLIVVATQCVEAGADLDFDALVTEVAPLDCLRQRFGRLNRLGREIEARAAVVADAAQVRKSADSDPIYGDALRYTWNYLLERSTTNGKGKSPIRVIDFGIEASAAWFPSPEVLVKCVAPKKDAPILLPSAVELWARTSPIPAADPAVSLYLHGCDSGAGDVDVLWRADIDDGEPEEAWIERVTVCPPAAPEAISVPLEEARRWLRETASGDFPDTEAAPWEIIQKEIKPAANVLRWRGANDDQTKLIQAGAIRPGDVIVVPASRGGCDRWGWYPESKNQVTDVARDANRRQRARDILRLSKAELSEQELSFIGAMDDSPDDDIRAQFAQRFPDLGDGASSRLQIIRAKDGRPLAVEQRLPVRRRTHRSDLTGDAVTEDDESVRAIGRKAVRLSEHSRGVESYARRFAEQVGLSPELAHDVILAAYLHDAGKAHPNFKCFLYGGDQLAAVGGADLAKSAKLPGHSRAWDEVRRLADLPRGARHEVASLGLAEAHPRFAQAHDADLVLWLIGTHHGYGRPFFPAPERDWPGQGMTFEADLGDGKVSSKPAHSLPKLTSLWVDLCQRVTRRYGIWGLARLEAVLRLADHRRSEAEQE